MNERNMNDECSSLTSSTDVPAASTNSVILEMDVVQSSGDHGNLTDVGVVILETPAETSGTTGRENTIVL
jgi:hypothetical protein